MYKALRYIKVNGRFVDKGEVVDLSILSAQEIARLEKREVVVKTDDKTITESLPVGDTGNGDADGAKSESDNGANNSGEDDGSGGGEMTDEEARAELLKKITHTVAVKELKLLGAEFKANASLENLVDLIMENEDYENHFFDYIENNGL